MEGIVGIEGKMTVVMFQEQYLRNIYKHTEVLWKSNETVLTEGSLP